ncbi:hypothetical protein PISMIDRAFT_242599 [Pisolithus microcarpus 441]|uniref:Uncharacterized protein n=1 Tax=Pisolithus microcarpus 441 TaxID=765257 RepID=A0A0C9ZL16_9AGAM|nr:hypothetical protein PISMIDRAFT_242599 [Pisolithus microcarpus 441]
MHRSEISPNHVYLCNRGARCVSADSRGHPAESGIPRGRRLGKPAWLWTRECPRSLLASCRIEGEALCQVFVGICAA